MGRIVVVANPSASQFTGGAHRTVMSLLARTAEVEAVWPESPRDAADRAKQAADSGAGIVVAMGGDGIAHHVAQGLIDSDVALGIIPVGTTNVLARLLGIPDKPVKAAKLLIELGDTPVSVGTALMRLQRGAVETTHHAVFAAGFGLDAAVVLEADRDPYRKYRFGSVHYARTALGVALRDFPRREPNLVVRVGETQDRAGAALLQFREVYTYFGRVPLRIAPEAPDPMTMLTMARLRRRHIPRIIAALLANRDLGLLPDMTVTPNVKRAEVSADPPVAAQADGESLGMVDGGMVEWAPASLRVIAPTGHTHAI